MPPSPIKLKEKLLKALDEENNVTNSGLVLEVIALLETTALTREDLETTRLGFYVNNLRKKTADQELAKRCRKLVKSWQQLVNLVPSNNASPAPGYSPALNTARRSPASSAYVPCSPKLITKCNASPYLQPISKARLTSPASSQFHSSERLVSPLVKDPGIKISPASTRYGKQISPCNSRLTTPTSNTRSSVSPNGSSSSRPGTPNRSKLSNTNLANHTEKATPQNNHSNFSPSLDATNRTHAANKKRRRSDDSINSDNSSIKKSRHVVNGESSRLTERIKTPKVKTTVELIAELQVQKSTRLTPSDTITKIVTNQIQKEEDDINLSVVPPSARPRFRRKHGNVGMQDSPTATDLIKTKSELVERFLQQTVQLSKESNATEVCETGDNGIDTRPNSIVSKECRNKEKPVIDTSIDPYSLLPPLDYDNIPWSDDEDIDNGNVCRNAITGEYPDGYESDSNTDNDPNELIVSKVINDEWDGVNGTVNVNRQFHAWTETFTISNNEDRNASIHILPYVDI